MAYGKGGLDAATHAGSTMDAASSIRESRTGLLVVACSRISTGLKRRALGFSNGVKAPGQTTGNRKLFEARRLFMQSTS